MSIFEALTSAAGPLPCRSHSDPDLWFADAPTRVAEARDRCHSCPIRALCLASAIESGESGVWGGELLDRGSVLPFKRPVGRPRRRKPVQSRIVWTSA
jgi:WhiB family transcriptional regulator, redox-sensing transcriptional regulator